MNIRENIITDYFNSWVQKDASILDETFSPNVIYIESWGPAYKGIEQVKAWFTGWNKENTVIAWDIKEFLHDGSTSICEWYFKCDCDGNIDGFNGVSIIVFDKSNKIELLKEFQSKIPNNYPYEK